jgi:salicylate hydroxylase
VPPNSARLLHSWGLEEELSKKSVKPEGLIWRRWQTGEAIAHTRLNPQFSEWFGSPYYVTHRAHLHEVLHDRARELGVLIQLASKVTWYDPDGGSVKLENGSTVHVDLVVAADGEILFHVCPKRIIIGRTQFQVSNHKPDGHYLAKLMKSHMAVV